MLKHVTLGPFVMIKWFPLILLSILFYNVLIFAGPWLTSTTTDVFLARAVHFRMFSGDVWTFAIGDLVVLVTLGLLFVEVIKATRTGAVEILNHGLSMLVFVASMVEFLVLKGFSTTTFFFIVVMALFDVVAGFTISIVAAKRDLGTTGGLIGTN